MSVRLARLDDIRLLLIHDKHIKEKELVNSITLGRTYILERETFVVGWLRYNLFWDNTPFLNMLYILEEYRGLGQSKVLMKYWEEKMKELGYSMVLLSTQENETTKYLYKKLGYNEIGGFNLPNESYEIIMGKTI